MYIIHENIPCLIIDQVHELDENTSEKKLIFFKNEIIIIILNRNNKWINFYGFFKNSEKIKIWNEIKKNYINEKTINDLLWCI